MDAHKNDPILLVCADQDRAFEILAKLYDEDFMVVGSAPSASTALTLTAQTMPRIALIAGPTSGRRSAEELAGELTAMWGVECFVLSLAPDAAQSPAEQGMQGPIAELRNALGAAILHPTPTRKTAA